VKNETKNTYITKNGSLKTKIPPHTKNEAKTCKNPKIHIQNQAHKNIKFNHDKNVKNKLNRRIKLLP